MTTGQPRRLSLRDFLLIRGEGAGLHAHLIAIHHVIERGAQAAMVVILQRNEAKRLQYAIGHRPHWGKNFRHTVHGAGLRLKGNFDEVALSQ